MNFHQAQLCKAYLYPFILTLGTSEVYSEDLIYFINGECRPCHFNIDIGGEEPSEFS